MKEKAKIIKVGGFVNTCTGLQPVGWSFDGSGRNVAAIEIVNNAVQWGGWTLEELREIAARPSEFVEMPP